MDSGLDLTDLDAVTVADQPREPYHTAVPGAQASCEWKQATETVTLYIPVRAGTSSRTLAVQIKPQRLHVAYRGTSGQLLLEAELGGKCDPYESEWRVEGSELVVELRKAQWREWLVPLTPVGGGGGESTGAAPTAATGASPPARPAVVTAYPPPPAAARGEPQGTSLGNKYAEWDRFDQTAALTDLANEGLPDEPGMRLRSAGGKGGAVGIEYTDYKKDKEEVPGRGAAFT